MKTLEGILMFCILKIGYELIFWSLEMCLEIPVQ